MPYICNLVKLKLLQMADCLFGTGDAKNGFIILVEILLLTDDLVDRGDGIITMRKMLRRQVLTMEGG